METKQPYKTCKNCPFLFKNEYMLTKGRKEELVEAFRRDQHFTCHNTIDYNNCDDDGNPDDSKGKFCVGALVAADRDCNIPQMARISARLGLLDMEEIPWDDDEIIDDLDDWVERSD